MTPAHQQPATQPATPCGDPACGCHRLADRIAQHAAEAGATVAWHARDLDRGGQAGQRDTEPVVTASVFKVAVALEVARQGTSASGSLDLGQRVMVPVAGRTPGPTGLSVMQDPVELSVRDLALLMLTVSDNAATDLLLGMVGRDAVNATLRRLGLAHTEVPQDCAEIIASIGQDLGIAYSDQERELAGQPLERLAGLRALQPAGTCHTTPEEITRLLALVWTDRAGPPEACAAVRHWMGLQLWPHRLPTGFADEVGVSGKTGTLPLVRNEAGVIHWPGPDGSRYAVGVFTRSSSPRARQPRVDALVGQVAAEAVGFLREAPTHGTGTERLA